MDYVNIISKEVVLAPPDWCFGLTLGICAVITLIGAIISFKQRFATLTPIMIFGGIAIVVEFALLFCFIKFCSVPTGRYEYEATINKEKITVSEYEEFLETYKPELRDGVYYWTSEEIE
jgi:hypothetical protein